MLLAKEGKPLYGGAFGEANKDFGVPNTLDTKFNLGSMNKMFTAVTIAQLVEQGKLSYDDPLSKFLPDRPERRGGEEDPHQAPALAHLGARQLLQRRVGPDVARAVPHASTT